STPTGFSLPFMVEIAENEDCISETEIFYHGFLPRQDIEPLLINDGDFLLRKTEWNGQITLSLAVRNANRILHFFINQDDEKYYYIEEHREKTVHDLMEWHKSTKTPITSASQAILKNGVLKPKWIMKNSAIRMTKKLGEGAFGEVYLAEFISDEGQLTKVAVKTMREHCTREARLKFMKEARIMRKFQHPNIVRIVGIVVDEHPLLILMELCPGGSVLSYLRRHRGRIDKAVKLRFCIEGAAGLAYLESSKCIHRDIAARNVLLTQTYEVKVSDFGMSEERTMFQDEKLEKVPIKWLAPETMQQRIYSIKTDVWSYGVMVTAFGTTAQTTLISDPQFF
uniref:Tyrosine-protein kinase n=2 Tax=Parascaris univalens TaxID=6257 RepID=A0A915CD16_PARUN